MSVESDIWHNKNEKNKIKQWFLVNKNSSDYSTPLNFC